MCFVFSGARKADGDGGASAAARTRERFFLFRFSREHVGSIECADDRRPKRLSSSAERSRRTRQVTCWVARPDARWRRSRARFRRRRVGIGSGTNARRRTDWREQSRGRGEDGAVHLRRVFRRDGRVFAGSRGHPRQRFSTSRGTPGRRERRAGSSGAARALGGPCACGAPARASAARTPHGGRRRHTRGRGHHAHRVVESIEGVAFRPALCFTCAVARRPRRVGVERGTLQG